MRRERIDRLLVELGLATSRTKAQALVMAGAVLVDEQRVDKPSDLFARDAPIRVKRADDPSSRYVGRGGVKLEGALREFGIDVDGMLCLDIWASTGGFSDFFSQKCARRGVGVVVCYKPNHLAPRQ